MEKITQKIVGYSIKKGDDEAPEPEVEIEKVHEKTKRPFALRGSTYKIKPPGKDSALYMTVNDIVINEGTKHEQRVPFEVFLNSKHMESFEWISTVTRLISAVLRKGGEIKFLVEELEGMFAPNGGYFGKVPNSKKGKYYNSVVSEIGSILRYHMQEINLIDKVHTIKEENEMKAVAPVVESVSELSETGGPACPECGEPNMKLLDGCYTCIGGCGHSKCG